MGHWVAVFGGAGGSPAYARKRMLHITYPLLPYVSIARSERRGNLANLKTRRKRKEVGQHARMSASVRLDPRLRGDDRRERFRCEVQIEGIRYIEYLESIHGPYKLPR